MFTALVLVCSLSATPDLHACGRDNAVDVLVVPDPFGSAASCLMQGQAYLAQTALGRDLQDDERVKVVCVAARQTARRIE
jgi:hypothetical protein